MCPASVNIFGPKFSSHSLLFGNYPVSYYNTTSICLHIICEYFWWGKKIEKRRKIIFIVVKYRLIVFHSLVCTWLLENKLANSLPKTYGAANSQTTGILVDSLTHRHTIISNSFFGIKLCPSLFLIYMLFDHLDRLIR